jgi:histidine ammonia-lyase
VRRSRRLFAGACLDWTERRPHVNGALGAALTGRLLALGWVEPGPRHRAVRVTPAGRAGLAATFGWYPGADGGRAGDGRLSAMRTVSVNGDALTVADVVDVARGTATAELAASAAATMEPSRAVVAAAIQGDAPVYGVNTGFGALADTRVGEQDLTRLQGAIVRSHAAGTGAPLDDPSVRAVLLLRARTLAAGYSGVRADVPARLIELLRRDLLPVVPGKGSVGASGDLAQLAHLAQPLIGEGRLRAPGDPPHGRPAAEVLAEHGIAPLVLAPKEGLSLVNGTEPMQALLAFSVHDAAMLVTAADVACALSVEALLGTDRPYDERVQALRPHPGQLDSAANLRALLAGSPLLASHRHSRHAVQDAYCLRCAPQVHGAVRDVLAHARRVLEIELGSVVDNPVVVPDGEVMTTGNFHGEPLAFAADMLAMALAELASISERRVDRMLDPAFSRGLPPFLAPAAGTNSGFMLAQYTAASLVSENKVLAHPASVDTIPTSGKQEDHVSMGWTAVRKLRDVVANVRSCLAVEVCCAAQGIDLRAGVAAPSEALAAAHAAVRAQVPMMEVDREVAGQIAAVDALLPSLAGAAAAHCGPLR